MKKIITEDGSITYYNEEFQDYYHSIKGAKSEAVIKHINALNIKESSKILDICFGLGYNSAAALDVLENVEIIGLEIDEEILTKIENLNPFKSYYLIKKVAKEKYVKEKNKNIKLIMGDATKTIKEIDEKFDYVFFDPFSPSKDKKLWSLEFIKDVYQLMNKGASLSTYSCAGFVKRNFLKAGFEIKEGPRFGRRTGGIIAIKK